MHLHSNRLLTPASLGVDVACMPGYTHTEWCARTTASIAIPVNCLCLLIARSLLQDGQGSRVTGAGPSPASLRQHCLLHRGPAPRPILLPCHQRGTCTRHATITVASASASCFRGSCTAMTKDRRDRCIRFTDRQGCNVLTWASRAAAA